jgi:two-component system cell cycle response regulator
LLRNVGDQPRDRTSKTITAVEPAQPAARRRGEACVVVLYGPELGRRATIGRGTFQIGRSSKNELPIDQESVSRHHARITSAHGGRAYAIEDLGSTNGTYVNDEKVNKGERSPLKDGDQIRVGRSILKFMSGTNLEANYHEEIYRLMTVDALTQVYNKRYFSEALEREYNRAIRYKRDLSLVLFDVDHFKKVNDEHGHLAGDAVLRQVAAEVKPKLREQDIFARVGGEEFAALLPEINHEGAMATGEKVRRIVEAAKFDAEKVVVRITISAGVTSLDPRGRDPNSLFERADAALYEAKRKGRNRVQSS